MKKEASLNSDIFVLIGLLHYYNILLVIYFSVKYWKETFENNLIFI